MSTAPRYDAVGVDPKLATLVVQDGPVEFPFLADGVLEIKSGLISSSATFEAENTANVVFAPFATLPGGVTKYGNTYKVWNDIKSLAASMNVTSILNIYLDWTGAAGQPLPIGGIIGPLVRMLFNNNYTTDIDPLSLAYPQAIFSPGHLGTPTEFMVGLYELEGPFELHIEGNQTMQTFMWPSDQISNTLRITRGARLTFDYVYVNLIADVTVRTSAGDINILVDNSAPYSNSDYEGYGGGCFSTTGLPAFHIENGQQLNVKLVGGGQFKGLPAGGHFIVDNDGFGPPCALNIFYDSLVDNESLTPGTVNVPVFLIPLSHATATEYKTGVTVAGAIAALEAKTTFPLRGSDGSLGAPSYSFSGETNMGMYRNAAGQLDLAVGGNAVIDIKTGHLGVAASTSFTGDPNISGAYVEIAPPLGDAELQMYNQDIPGAVIDMLCSTDNATVNMQRADVGGSAQTLYTENGLNGFSAGLRPGSAAYIVRDEKNGVNSLVWVPAAGTSGALSVAGSLSVSGIATVTNAAASTSTGTGALVITSGGLGVGGRINAGGFIATADGAAATPSYNFNGDATTGIWRTPTNGVAISTAGVQRLDIENGSISVAQNLSIGGNLTHQGALLGVYGAAVVAQPTGGAYATRAATGIVPAFTADTYTGGVGAQAYSIGQVVAALKSTGMIAS